MVWVRRKENAEVYHGNRGDQWPPLFLYMVRIG